MHELAAWGTQLNAGSPEAGRRPNEFPSGECLIGEQYAADRHVARITKNKNMLLLVFIILNDYRWLGIGEDCGCNPTTLVAHSW